MERAAKMMNKGNTIGKSIGARIIAIMVQIAKIPPIIRPTTPGSDKQTNTATENIIIDAIAIKIPTAPIISTPPSKAKIKCQPTITNRIKKIKNNAIVCFSYLELIGFI
jgi:hypothetical protein